MPAIPIASAMSSAGNFPPSAAGGASSTSEFQFADSAGNALVAYIPGSNKLSNKPFRVRAWGRVTGGTTNNFTAKIYYGSTSGTSLATTGAIAVNSVSGNWMLVLDCVWDSTSGKIQGIFKGHVNGTAVAQAILSSVTTPGSTVLPSTASSTSIYFSASGTFSGSNAGNAAYLDGLTVEDM